MTYRFMTPALRELDSAAAYYENRREGLGLQFIAVNRKLLARILENPRQFPAISGRLRKAGMRRFPYSIIFRVEPRLIRVVAIAHGHQRPGYWKNRLK